MEFLLSYGLIKNYVFMFLIVGLMVENLVLKLVEELKLGKAPKPLVLELVLAT
jgi:hypothetical protein